MADIKVPHSVRFFKDQAQISVDHVRAIERAHREITDMAASGHVNVRALNTLLERVTAIGLQVNFHEDLVLADADPETFRLATLLLRRFA